MAEVTARSAYFAAFHAAEAYFEKNGKVAKTRGGVRTEFSGLAKDDPMIPPDMPAFLRQAYRFKEISDYGTATDEAVTMETAAEAIASAETFITLVRAALDP